MMKWRGMGLGPRRSGAPTEVDDRAVLLMTTLRSVGHETVLRGRRIRPLPELTRLELERGGKGSGKDRMTERRRMLVALEPSMPPKRCNDNGAVPFALTGLFSAKREPGSTPPPREWGGHRTP